MDRPRRAGLPALLLMAVALTTALTGALVWVGRDPAGRDRPRHSAAFTPAAASAAGVTPGADHVTTPDTAPDGADDTAPDTSSAATVVDGLHPGLERAFDAARAAARAAGHRLTLTSGFRTADEQAALLAEAIDEHGSEEEALRWVFPPDRSMHVRGLAVDVGDGHAAEWLDDHGAAYGLCRTLSWEWWHFEWRPDWERSGTCPAPVHDPADAPGVSP